MGRGSRVGPYVLTTAAPVHHYPDGRVISRSRRCTLLPGSATFDDVQRRARYAQQLKEFLNQRIGTAWPARAAANLRSWCRASRNRAFPRPDRQFQVIIETLWPMKADLAIRFLAQGSASMLPDFTSGHQNSGAAVESLERALRVSCRRVAGQKSSPSSISPRVLRDMLFPQSAARADSSRLLSMMAVVVSHLPCGRWQHQRPSTDHAASRGASAAEGAAEFAAVQSKLNLLGSIAAPRGAQLRSNVEQLLENSGDGPAFDAQTAW